MRIRTSADKWIFVVAVTAVSVLLSLVVTSFVSPVGLTAEVVLVAITVPSCVAPCVALLMAKMMLQIHTLNRQLERMVRHDQMTGLLTRGAFFERVADVAEPRPGAVLLSDIDRFKEINDTFGHDAGDQVIRSVGQTLLDDAKPEGVAARFGGEEFVSFYPDLDLEHAELRADAIRSAVENQSIRVSGRDLSCTLSIGVGYFDGHQPLDEVLQRADEALYAAKGEGRNRVVRQKVRAVAAE